MQTPLVLDGSFGEGGGQILRSALSLSLVTGQPFVIENIRARRGKPGLQRQHLTAVLAATAVGGAVAEGATLGSRRLSFEPREIVAGEHRFDIGTAGSVSLVLQTLLPALCLGKQSSRLTVVGGTHNIHAPPFEFLTRSYMPLLCRMGPQVSAVLQRHGFYPAGGGRVVVEVQPASRLTPLDLADAGPIVRRSGTAKVARLPRHIADRERQTLIAQSGWPRDCFSVEEIDDSDGPGNIVLIEIERQRVVEVFTGFGQRGVRAEEVAAGVWRQAKRYLQADAPVGEHLADQLLLPLGLCAGLFGGEGAFRTLDLSEHSRTHIEVLRKFLPIEAEVDRRGADDVVVRVRRGARS